MKETIKFSELPSRHQAILGCAHLRGSKFVYALEKNLSFIDSQRKNAERFQKKLVDKYPTDTELQKAFIAEYNPLVKQYAVLDEQGNPVLKYGDFDIKEEHKEEWSKVFKELKDKHSAYTSNIDSRIKEMDEFEKEEIEIDWYEVSEKEIPFEINLSEKQSIAFMYNAEKQQAVKLMKI